MQLVATCAFGLEKLLYSEIKKLGLWIDKTEDGRIFFQGDQSDLVRANLWLRTAERIYIQLTEFKAQTFDELFDQTFTLNWKEILPEGAHFPVLCSSVKSKLHHEPTIQSIVKKSIVKKLQSKYDKKFSRIPETGPLYSIMIRLRNDICSLCIDSSGESLHKRGYRSSANESPIKETLAAAMVMLSDWPATDKNNKLRTLIDPFCGSGTILIEAAMIALNIPPGLNRKFAFDNWREFKAMNLDKIRNEAKEKSLIFNSTTNTQAPKLQIYGYDIDSKSIKIAQTNSTRAGLQKFLHFTKSDFQTLKFSNMKNTTIITNPPYGNRISSPDESKEIYLKLGKKFQETQNSSLYIITPNTDFENLFGAKATKNRKLFNGKIKCYLYSYPASQKIIKSQSQKNTKIKHFKYKN